MIALAALPSWTPATIRLGQHLDWRLLGTDCMELDIDVACMHATAGCIVLVSVRASSNRTAMLSGDKKSLQQHSQLICCIGLLVLLPNGACSCLLTPLAAKVRLAGYLSSIIFPSAQTLDELEKQPPQKKLRQEPGTPWLRGNHADHWTKAMALDAIHCSAMTTSSLHFCPSNSLFWVKFKLCRSFVSFRAEK